jgi:hypothetical protein
MLKGDKMKKSMVRLIVFSVVLALVLGSTFSASALNVEGPHDEVLQEEELALAAAGERIYAYELYPGAGTWTVGWDGMSALSPRTYWINVDGVTSYGVTSGSHGSYTVIGTSVSVGFV